MSRDNAAPVVPRGFVAIFAMLTSCFALWGLLNNMTDNLVPSFQRIFMTSQSTAGFVQISFYGAYSVIALLASFLIQRAGYRVGVLAGLGADGDACKSKGLTSKSGCILRFSSIQ